MSKNNIVPKFADGGIVYGGGLTSLGNDKGPEVIAKFYNPEYVAPMRCYMGKAITARDLQLLLIFQDESEL